MLRGIYADALSVKTGAQFFQSIAVAATNFENTLRAYLHDFNRPLHFVWTDDKLAPVALEPSVSLAFGKCGSLLHSVAGPSSKFFNANSTRHTGASKAPSQRSVMSRASRKRRSAPVLLRIDSIK